MVDWLRCSCSPMSVALDRVEDVVALQPGHLDVERRDVRL